MGRVYIITIVIEGYENSDIHNLIAIKQHHSKRYEPIEEAYLLQVLLPSLPG
jgi:hypothetical protein